MTGFPNDLQEILREYKVIKANVGRIGDKIIKLSNGNDVILYLKICETEYAKDEMKSEYNILKWLSFKELNVPKVLLYKEDAGKAYLLLSNIKGDNSCDDCGNLSKNEVLKICANALKKVHKIDIRTVPIGYSDCLGKELAEISQNINDNMIDVEAFKKANDGRLPYEVLSYLMDRKSMFNSDVFTHGDYCLPNILIVDSDNYGLVDWSGGGVGDIYRDIASVIKSIIWNFGKEYTPLFFDYYGISRDGINTEKIKYYNAIDQFYYHKKRSW